MQNEDFVNRSSFIQPRVIEHADNQKLSLLKVYCEATCEEGIEVNTFVNRMRDVITLSLKRGDNSLCEFCQKILEKYEYKISKIGLKDLTSYLIAGLCDNIDTTFYEIRAVYLDKVSVGRFVIQRDLDLVDFNADTNLFYAFNSENNDSLIDVIKHKILFKKISADLSKPLRRYDTEIEYVPTQLICEYCKHNGADGIMFKSSLHKTGTNIVLFNKDDAKCTKVYTKEITNVTITGE